MLSGEKRELMEVFLGGLWVSGEWDGLALDAKGKDLVRQRRGGINKGIKGTKNLLPISQLNYQGLILVITSSELVATYTTLGLSSHPMNLTLTSISECL